MKVLVIGSGGKIHALIWKLFQSEKVSDIFCTFSNACIKNLATVINIRENETDEIYDFVKNNNIDLTIIDSTAAAVKGLADKLRKEGFNVFGANEKSCKIEMNKGFTKKFLYKNKIPTPQFGVFDKESQAITYARNAKYPLVIKFDSRIPGTGTIICNSFNEAKNVISFCLKNLYKPIVIEKFVTGKHVSFQVITDGYDAVPLPASYVYKKVNDGDFGFNTEGMGAYSPVSGVDSELEAKIGEKIFFPLIDGLNSEKMSYAGLLRANIVIDNNNNPLLLGISVGFGDPETQAILPLLDEDLFDIMMLSSMGALADTYEVFNFHDEHSVCINMIADGYPNNYKRNCVIEGLEEIDDDNTLIFQGGTEKNIYAETVSTTGRVLDIVSTASTLNRAREYAYESADLIEFQGMKYRKDIAKQSSEVENMLF